MWCGVRADRAGAVQGGVQEVAGAVEACSCPGPCPHLRSMVASATVVPHEYGHPEQGEEERRVPGSGDAHRDQQKGWPGLETMATCRSRGGRRGSAVEEVDVDVRAGSAPDPAWSRQRRKTSSSPPRSDWRGGDHGVLRWLALPLGGCCQRRKKRRKRRRRQEGKEERTRVRRRGSGLGCIPIIKDMRAPA